MRVFLATLGAMAVLLAGTAAAAGAQVNTAAQERTLTRSLRQGVGIMGGDSGAYVVDLNTGQTLFSQAPTVGRLPASLEKIYTTTTALLLLGPNATFTTSILGEGSWGPDDTWDGTLFLKGGGDPTFGSIGFDRAWYGTGTTLGSLTASLLHKTHIAAVNGAIVGDESYFDSLRGTPATGYSPDLEVEGELSALAYNRGFTDLDGDGLQRRPALYATQQFESSLRAYGVSVPAKTPVFTGHAPSEATVLASVASPKLSTLIALTNAPSDNYFAETLLKDIGARVGGAGTTAAGAAVVRNELLTKFKISPRLNDGSGLSRSDSTTPVQIVDVLESLASNTVFTNSLAVAGETGTMQDEARGTTAQGNCRGKTGSLHDVANLAGYCRARDGHTLAFAFMGNGLGDPDYVHEVEANMAVALAKYDG